MIKKQKYSFLTLWLLVAGVVLGACRREASEEPKLTQKSLQEKKETETPKDSDKTEERSTEEGESQDSKTKEEAEEQDSPSEGVEEQDSTTGKDANTDEGKDKESEDKPSPKPDEPKPNPEPTPKPDEPKPSPEPTPLPPAPKPEPAPTPPVPTPPSPEPTPAGWSGKTLFVKGVKVPELSQWGYTDVYMNQGLKWQKEYGWYDANKEQPELGGADCNVCWAATASNTLNWWLDQNKDYIRRYGKFNGPQDYTDSYHSDIFLHFKKNFPNKGGDIRGGLRWFLTGYYALEELPGGGFFKDVLGTEPVGREINARSSIFALELYKALRDGEAIACAEQYPRGFLHGISIWGVEFDRHGGVSALYVTDSNDREIEDQKEGFQFKGKFKTKAGLMRRRVKEQNGFYYFESSVPGRFTFKISFLYFMGTYKDKWEAYLSQHGK